MILIAIHTLLSLAAIAIGFPAMMDLFRARSTSTAIAVFLALAILTSLSGFLLPFGDPIPAVSIGTLTLVILALTLIAQRSAARSLLRRLVVVGGMVASLYVIILVGLVQAFLTIGPLHAASPTQGDLPFLVAQAIALLGFLVLGILTARPFQPGSLQVAAAR